MPDASLESPSIINWTWEHLLTGSEMQVSVQCRQPIAPNIWCCTKPTWKKCQIRRRTETLTSGWLQTPAPSDSPQNILDSPWRATTHFTDANHARIASGTSPVTIIYEGKLFSINDAYRWRPCCNAVETSADQFFLRDARRGLIDYSPWAQIPAACRSKNHAHWNPSSTLLVCDALQKKLIVQRWSNRL